MKQKYYLQMITRWFLIQLLLAIAAVPVDRSYLYCPITCTCVMDEVLEDNEATCSFGNSTAKVSWYMRNAYLTLEIICKDAVDNFIYNCNDWPHFNITIKKDYPTYLAVTGCAPSVMRCVNLMLITATNFSIVNTTMMAGTYTSEDIIDFDHVHQVELTLRDQDTKLPVAVANTLPALKALHIMGGNLKFSSNAFNQSHLINLHLDLNNIKLLPSDSFKGLSNLKHLTIRHNSFKHLGPHAFRGLDAAILIIMTNNTLSSIDSTTFSSLKKLDSLLIINNMLEFVPNGLLNSINKLHMVRISLNQVELTLDTNALANLSSTLVILEIYESKLKHLPEHVLDGSIYIEMLDFKKNAIKSLPSNVFATQTALRYLHLGENKIKHVPDQLFYKTKLLEHVNISYNCITTLSGKLFTYSPELKEVILDYNRLTYIDLDIFNGTKLEILSLASNKLQRIVVSNTLEWQTRFLNLSHNILNVFEEWFSEIPSLEYLDLSGNKLKMIKESHIYRMNSNVTIDLRNNSINEVVRDIFDTFVNVIPSNVTLYLSNNPLQCDCVVTTLLKEWHKYGILADYEDITCDNEGKLSKLDVYVQCNKTHAFVALLGSSIVGSFVVFITLLSIFSNRRAIWANISNLFKPNYLEDTFKKSDNNTTLEMKDEVKLYDLFISFAHKDADIVTDKLLPILENDFKLKVCVHYRDWVVGDLIPVQIRESVERSSMTMIILTEYFLESEWSNLEFHTAHELSIADGKPRVIIVLINESITRHNKLRGDLKTYIDMNTYLIWDDAYFWDKLQKILPKYGNSKLKKSYFK